MTSTHPIRIRLLATLSVAILASTAWPAAAQELTDDMVGQNESAWNSWHTAMRALERDEKAEATKLLDSIATMSLSDLRLALMADRSGTLRLEAWASEDGAPAVATELVAKITAGRRHRGLAEDGWHFAAIGRFQYADANFKALIDANPDPVALLELARQNPNRHDILVKLIGNADVGPSAGEFLKLLGRGEQILRTDANEIVANIAKLGGRPRMVYNATNRLKDAGEYAVPHLIKALQDSSRSNLHAAIIQVLPKIGRDALNPICMALGMDDDVTRKILIRTAVEIHYKQAAPYLAKLVEDASQSGDVRAEAQQAVGSLGVAGSVGLASLFLELAEHYYNDVDSLKADSKSDEANVWYLRGADLKFRSVPRAIFNDIMAMRCCEEALLASPGTEAATALWLAANTRREAKLGLDVESVEPDALAAKDSTRPADFPRAIYFLRAAGARYNHLVLGRGFADRDAGVALGAIAALSDTAGEPSLVGAENIKQPLIQTLSFPNRQVRIKAALALGRALPASAFSGSQNVMPVLAEALLQSDRRAALIIDADDNIKNKFQALFRAAGYDCALGSNLYEGLQNGKRANLTSFDVALLGSDIESPNLDASVSELRKQFASAATPILIVTKADDLGVAKRTARGAKGVEVLLADVIDIGDETVITQQIMTRLGRASQALGMSPLDRDLSLDLAIRAADTVRAIALSNRTVYDTSRVTPALIMGLKSSSEALRVRCSHALALAKSADAQEAILESALDATHSQSERIAEFGDLAEAARRNGNLLGDREVVSRLIELALNEKDLVLRTAASKALGALDLSGDKASEIIRAQHDG